MMDQSEDQEPIPRECYRDIQRLIMSTPSNKAPGPDGLKIEHLKILSPDAVSCLSSIFQAMLLHGYVPTAMTKTVITPIPKSKTGDRSSSANYRGIALPNVISKIFEMEVMRRIAPYLVTRPTQFGFKREHSTTLATLALKESINYFISRGSRVYCAFFDIKNAFGELSHPNRFQRLRERKVPAYLTNTLIFWHNTLRSFVRWCGKISQEFQILSGVRQGGVLSPSLFNVYLDTLLAELKDIERGCFIGGFIVNCIAYADDLVLMAPTKSGLQVLLDTCTAWARREALLFNPSKPFAMVFSSLPTPRLLFPPRLGDVPLKQVAEFTYLGHVLTENLSDDADVKRAEKKFLVAANIILRRFHHFDQMALLKLMEAFGSFYGDVLWFRYSRMTMRRLTTSFHNVVKRIAGLPPWARSHETCAAVGTLSLEAMLGKRTLQAAQHMLKSGNILVKALFSSEVGSTGLLRSKILRVREELHLFDCDLALVQKEDLQQYLQWYTSHYYDFV